MADTSLKELKPLDVLADDGSVVSSYSSSDAGSPKAPVPSPLTSSSTMGQHSPSTSDNIFDNIVPLVSMELVSCAIHRNTQSPVHSTDSSPSTTSLAQEENMQHESRLKDQASSSDN